MSANQQGRIGIMADSHGRVGRLEQAVKAFDELGCDPVVHLGDVCDSTNYKTAEACVEVLREAGVRAIKGNNDHHVVVNHDGYDSPIVSQDTVNWLKNLPASLEIAPALFVHSMPWVKEMGLSAMVRSMGKRETAAWFSQRPKAILFRGHSHSPRIHRLQAGRVQSRALEGGQALDLDGLPPCMVTCGALTRGFFMVWEPAANRLECRVLG